MERMHGCVKSDENSYIVYMYVKMNPRSTPVCMKSGVGHINLQ